MSVRLHSCIYLPDNQATNRKGKDKQKTGRKRKKNKDKVEDAATKKSKKST